MSCKPIGRICSKVWGIGCDCGDNCNCLNCCIHKPKAENLIVEETKQPLSSTISSCCGKNEPGPILVDNNINTRIFFLKKENESFWKHSFQKQYYQPPIQQKVDNENDNEEEQINEHFSDSGSERTINEEQEQEQKDDYESQIKPKVQQYYEFNSMETIFNNDLVYNNNNNPFLDGSERFSLPFLNHPDMILPKGTQFPLKMSIPLQSSSLINKRESPNQIPNQNPTKPKKGKQWICLMSDCGKSFSCSGHLRRHHLTHTKVKPYVCDFVGCEKGFTQSGDLKRHKLLHTGDRPYSCTHSGCAKSFSRSYSLYQHFKTHQRHQ